jgi:hypothetical protein
MIHIWISLNAISYGVDAENIFQKDPQNSLKWPPKQKNLKIDPDLIAN